MPSWKYITTQSSKILTWTALILSETNAHFLSNEFLSAMVHGHAHSPLIQRTSWITGLEAKVYIIHYSMGRSFELHTLRFRHFPKSISSLCYLVWLKERSDDPASFLSFVHQTGKKSGSILEPFRHNISRRCLVRSDYLDLLFYESCYMATYSPERLSLLKGFPCWLWKRKLVIFLSPFLLGKLGCWQSVTAW